MKYYVGIDIGGTNIKYGLVTESGQIVTDSHVKTANNGESIFAEISKTVGNYQKEYEVQAVGVSAPGIILDNGFMVTGGAIHDFYGINLKEELEIRLNLPVAVENDANCAALAEKWLGTGRDYHHLLAVVVGTGIGGGIIINDQLFRGGHATAGEFGFMMVEPIVNNDSRMATLSLTGSVGCGVVNKYAEAANLNESNYLNGEEIFALVNQGEALANQVVADFYDRLAIGIFNMAVSFDPEIILIGGAISSNQGFMAELTRRVHELKDQHRDMKTVTLPDIQPCQFLNQAGIIGATYKALLAQEKVGNHGK